jgi:hypothetical protein
MKKLLFPLASLVVGIICSVAITGHSSPMFVPDQVDERPRTTFGDGVIKYAPVRTNINADQDEKEFANEVSEIHKT